MFPNEASAFTRSARINRSSNPHPARAGDGWQIARTTGERQEHHGAPHSMGFPKSPARRAISTAIATLARITSTLYAGTCTAPIESLRIPSRGCRAAAGSRPIILRRAGRRSSAAPFAWDVHDVDPGAVFEQLVGEVRRRAVANPIPLSEPSTPLTHRPGPWSAAVGDAASRAARYRSASPAGTARVRNTLPSGGGSPILEST